jgi:hypothetical protein
MIGEIYFAERNFTKAIEEFQQVMYRYGGTSAPDDIKNWQAKSAIEAGRCSEVLIGELRNESRTKAIQAAKDFYRFVTENHAQNPLAEQAKSRLAELEKLP